ncbi:MAG: OadG family protein [Butyrivibrio sp.]|nr:OadG family protein [Butyrivibrio sp.]
MRRNAKTLLTGVPAILLLTGCDESIVNAGYNTLLGMGMAFAVLIIISLVISLLSVINRAQESKKADNDKDMRLKAIDNTISRIEQQENAQAQAAPPAPAAPAVPAAPAAPAAPDGGELIAVISAAVAAYESETGSTAGVVYAQPALPAKQPLPDLTNWEGVYVRSIRKPGAVNWKRA